MTLRDYYEKYVPCIHPRLKVLCDNEKEHDAFSYNFTDIKDYAVSNEKTTICDIYLILNEDRMESLLDLQLDENYSAILALIDNDKVWTSLSYSLNTYYADGFYRPAQPFSPNRIVTLEGLYGTYLLSKNNYSNTLYYSATHNNYNVPINTHICPDLLSAIHYCVEEEFGILIKKIIEFLNV